MFEWLKSLLGGGGDSADATEVALAAQFAEAVGYANAAATSALESCVRRYESAFLGATLSGVPGVTAESLAVYVRRVIADGESFALVVPDGLMPATSVDIRQGPDAAGLEYRLQLYAPDNFEQVVVPSRRCAHFVWSRDPTTWWRGRGPMTRASVTAAAMSLAERAALEEGRVPTAAMVPLPADYTAGQREVVKTGLAEAIRGGKKLLLPVGAHSSASPFSAGGRGPSSADFMVRRIQPAPDASLVQLRAALADAVRDACGVPSGLITGAAGPLVRESYRQFIAGSVMPLAQHFAAELRQKIPGSNPVFNFDALGYRQGQSFGRDLALLVGAGVELDEARAMLGAAA